MTVHCPHCTTGYLLPDHLMGPRGARVRCPACRRPFVVLREGAPTSGPGAPAGEKATVVATGAATAPAVAAPDPAPAPADANAEAGGEAPSKPESVAAEILEALAARLGKRLVEARERGRLLAELGPELVKAYDEYCARAGAEAPREAFRSVLRERLGVDLFGGR